MGADGDRLVHIVYPYDSTEEEGYARGAGKEDVTNECISCEGMMTWTGKGRRREVLVSM